MEVSTTLSELGVRHTSCRPSSLTVPQFYGTASYTGNVCVRLRQIVEVGQACVTDRYILPVAERVYEPSNASENSLMMSIAGHLTRLKRLCFG